jgi:hypothetical protein
VVASDPRGFFLDRSLLLAEIVRQREVRYRALQIDASTVDSAALGLRISNPAAFE